MGVVHIAVRGGRKRCIRGAYVENSGVVLNSTVGGGVSAGRDREKTDLLRSVHSRGGWVWPA